MREIRLEPDHIFIGAASGAPETASLEQAGLKPDGESNARVGQGTSSISISFENAHLESIWIDDEDAAARAGLAMGTDLLTRARWRTTRACPFGIALRCGDTAAAALPFPVRPYSAEWMRPGDPLLIAERASDLRGSAHRRRTSSARAPSRWRKRSS